MCVKLFPYCHMGSDLAGSANTVGSALAGRGFASRCCGEKRLAVTTATEPLSSPQAVMLRFGNPSATS